MKTGLWLSLAALVLGVWAFWIGCRPVHAQEPDITVVQEMAQSAIQDTEALDRTIRRARQANLLPDRWSVAAGWTTDRDDRTEQSISETWLSGSPPEESDVRDLGRRDTGTRWDVTVRVEWRLSELVWDPDELAIRRSSLEAHARRAEVLLDVCEAWYERQAALARAADARARGRVQDEAAALLEAEWAAARLDVWTDGRFSEWRRAHGAGD